MATWEVFRGKVAVVTGAASGLGQGFAAAIARSGGTVVAADVAAEGLARTVDTIAAAGGKAEGRLVDVRDAAAVTALVDGAVEAHGRIDFVFNNAGIAVGGPVEEIPLEHWDEIVDINLKGVIYGTAAAYRHMVRQRSGHIVNTASLAGLIPGAMLAPYNAVKFAVVGLSESLSIEARAHGVHVTALCPGFIESGIYDAARRPPSLAGADMRSQIPYIVPLDKGVTQLLDGVARRKRIVTLPAYAPVMVWMYRLAPGLFFRMGRTTAVKQLAASAPR